MIKRGFKMGRIKAAMIMACWAISLAGCTSTYKPPLDIPAAPYVMSGISAPVDPVRIEDATDANTIIASRADTITFNVNLSQYSAALIASLERELAKQGVMVTPNAAKVIDIAVIDVEMAFPKRFRCDMNLKVEVDGKVIGIATDSEPDMSESKAINAAIADAVRKILTNKDVVAFLNR